MRTSSIEETAKQVTELLKHWRDLTNGDLVNCDWAMALRTRLASAESVVGSQSTSALVTDVYSAEWDEILCRSKLSGDDPDFEVRFRSLLSVVPSPDPFRDVPQDDLFAQVRDKLAIAADAAEVKGFPLPLIVRRKFREDSESHDLTGLAFSGGGIRSATFNLGVIQGLSSLGLLPQFDFVSTVSGGGYIGAWLFAWIKRGDAPLNGYPNNKASPEENATAKPTRNFDDVLHHLDPEVNVRGPQEALAPLAFLREFSNYLTPRLGFLSGDTWAAFSIYFRNTLLNLLIVVSFLSLILLVPRDVFWIQKEGGLWFNTDWRYNLLYFAAAWPLALILWNVRGFSCRPLRETSQDRSMFWFDTAYWRARWTKTGSSLPPWLARAVMPFIQPRQAVLTFILLPVCLASILGIGHIWRIRYFIEGNVPPTAIFNLPIVPITTLLIALIPSGLLFESIRRRWGLQMRLAVGILGLAASVGIGYLSQNFVVGLIYGFHYWVWILAAIAPILWFSGWVGGYWECARHARRLSDKPPWLRVFYFFGLALFLLILSGFAALSACQLLRLMAYAFREWETKPWQVAVWGPPMMITQLSLVAYLHVGLMGRDFPDARREWISRFAGALSVFSLGWISLFAISLYAPIELAALTKMLPGLHPKEVLTTLWTAVTGLTVTAARSRKTGDGSSGGAQKTLLSLLSVVGPYVFVIGLLVILAYGLNFALSGDGSVPIETIYRYVGGPRLWKLSGVCLLVVTILSLTVDVNEFSMHHFYRNRLVRCYLGASNYKRSPNGFTGFDERDDVPLSSFAPSQTTPGWKPYLGPYPIINTSLNMTSGERLAYQERKASSFIFTPRFCGVDSEALSRQLKMDSKPQPAYRPTLQYAYPSPGIHIGTAMAISGAALSPNEGFHSSPAAAFLLTLFNVRLGWWLGNPHREDKWTKASPWQGIFYLLKELFGASSDKSGYVYLSDGGHFDNMGLYELVKRKCRFIVLCDAEEDGAFAFDGLGNALRKIRADLGVEIEIDVDQIRPKEGKISEWHCVVGSIHYENLDAPDKYPVGTLLYLKSSLTGNEPSDILQYSLAHAEFPHQATSDQFFDESQFESYRRLGHHVAMTTFEKAVRDAKVSAKKAGSPFKIVDVFHSLNLLWFPPSVSTQKSFTRHVERLNDLHEHLRTDPNLRFLDRQFFIEWEHIAQFSRGPGGDQLADIPVVDARAIRPDPLWIPQRSEEIQAGFYFCGMLAHLMECVYLDLDLEEHSDHPDNQGWMNFFRRWAEAGMFRVAWSTTASTFGFRFRAFCERELRLQLGTIEICDISELHLTPYEQDRIDEIRREPSYESVPVCGLRLSLRSIDLKSGAEPFTLPFGMLILRQEQGSDLSQIAYMRVRRHLRRIGLGGRTLKKLLQSGNLDPLQPLMPEEKLPSRVRDRDRERTLRQFRRLISQAKQS